MSASSRSFTRRRHADMAARRERGDQGLPSCLKSCEHLSTDCCDSEVTYFHQFVLLKNATADAAASGLPHWRWAQLPRANAMASTASTRRRAIAEAAALERRLKARAGKDAAGRSDLRVRQAIAPASAVSAVMYRPGAQGQLRPFDALDLTAMLNAVLDLQALLGVAPGDSLAAAGALWAIGVEFEQVWECKGYRRGRLVRSIPLTAGEQMEIVTRTWDKQTIKKALLESVERNISTEVTGEQKWTQAVKNTFANQTNASVTPSAGVNAGLKLPIKAVEVAGGGALGLAGNLGATLSQAMETSSEYVQSAMMKAATSLKAVRTNSVDTVHEIGTEVTSKQVISNTNRCHSLTYHYFEVLEDFEVTTRPSEAHVYLLLPLPVPSISLDWVLCHECVIKPALPCTVFYRGLDAAKLLKTQETRSRHYSTSCGSPSGAQGGGGSAEAGSRLDPLIDAVLASYTALRDAKVFVAPNEPGTGVETALEDFGSKVGEAAREVGRAVGEGLEAAKDGVEEATSTIDAALTELGNRAADEWSSISAQAPRLLSMAPQSGNLMFATMPGFGTTEGGPGSWFYWRVVDIVAPELRDALSYLERSVAEIRASVPLAERSAAMRRVLDQFFGRLGHLDLLFGKIDGAIAIVTAGFAIGINPLYGPVVVAALLALAATVEAAGLADTIPDDEGLKARLLDVKAQHDADRTVQPMVPAPTSGAGTATEPNDPCANPYCADPCALAEAAVEWERLACHLNEHFLFYAQTVWAKWKDVQIMALAESFGIPHGAIEYAFTGFHGSRGAVRVTDLEWLRSQGAFDWQQELADALAGLPAAAAPDLITLPTQGMVVEPALGRCDGCEDFVAEHRRLDLDNKRAEVAGAQGRAAQAAEEARRLKLRNDAGTLTDPTPYEGGSTSVTVNSPTP